MSWTYRVVKDLTGPYSIREVHSSPGRPNHSWTDSTCSPYGETLEDLKESLKRFQLALDKPVLVEHLDATEQEVVLVEEVKAITPQDCHHRDCQSGDS